MDRIDAMKVFVSAVDEGSLAGAGRRLGRSPAAVSRAIAFLEAHVGTELLHRTTRALKLSEAGERYVAAMNGALQDQFLFATAFPLRPLVQHAADCRAFPLAKDAAAKFFSDNARGLLGLR